MRDALDGAATAIGAGGSDTPNLDAELLLAHVLEVDRAALFADPDRPVEGRDVRAFQDLVRRRAVGHEPVAYLVGRRAFRHIELAVDPRALIPRPETEHVVEAAVEHVAHGARVVDVGTGSGAIALALKDERPDLRVTGTDVSAEALAVARANGERLGQDVDWVRADLVPDGDWDAVVSNPPYVATGDPLPADVRHEPPTALLAGADGLDVLRRLVAEAHAPLLIVEIGAGQAPAVVELAYAAGWSRTDVRPDLAGIERVVIAWR